MRRLLLTTVCAQAMSLMPGCCFGVPSPDAPAVVAPPPMQPPSGPEAIDVAETLSVTLPADFDPSYSPQRRLRVVGTMGGTRSPDPIRDTAGTQCVGGVFVTPTIILTTTEPIAGLRILTRSDANSSLMVHLSDGRILCDDDGAGWPDALVATDVPAGVHRIFVGSLSDQRQPVSVAFTTDPSLMAIELP